MTCTCVPGEHLKKYTVTPAPLNFVSMANTPFGPFTGFVHLVTCHPQLIHALGICILRRWTKFGRFRLSRVDAQPEMLRAFARGPGVPKSVKSCSVVSRIKASKTVRLPNPCVNSQTLMILKHPCSRFSSIHLRISVRCRVSFLRRCCSMRSSFRASSCIFSWSNT